MDLTLQPYPRLHCRKHEYFTFLPICVATVISRRYKYPNIFAIHIRLIPDSSLGPETGSSDLGFSWYSLVSPGKFRDIGLN